jgi:cobalamin biosynthesis Mg chelatase CobN
VTLNEREQAELEARTRAELETQYAAAQARRETAASRATDRDTEKEEREREKAAREVKQKVTEQFWAEKGYVLYKDSRGRTSWLPREQAERRLAARKRAQKKVTRQSGLGVTLALIAIAVLIGLVLGWS